MELRKMGCEDGKWMELAQDRIQWRALVLAVLNLRVLLLKNIYLKFFLQQMYVMLLPLLSVLLILGALVLLLRNAKRARLIRLVDKIPGPPSYPFVGTELPMALAPRSSKY
jgi:hypothetical protein